MLGLFKRNRSIHVAVLGNCQARPVAQLLTAMSKRITVAAVGIVHLLQDHEKQQYENHLRDADWIFAQRVADDYPCAFVRTRALRKQWGTKVIVWPNIFFRGYNPELMYLRGTDRSPLRGPLGDYHNQSFLEAWKAGLRPRDALRRHMDVDFNQMQYGAIPHASLSELRRRETDCDVQVAEHIDRNRGLRRLFFTFNHPTAELLSRVAGCLMSRAGVRPDREFTLPSVEPLGQFSPPVNPWVAHDYNLEPHGQETWYGVEVAKIAADGVRTGDRKAYSGQEIVEMYYRIYDANVDRIG